MARLRQSRANSTVALGAVVDASTEGESEDSVTQKESQDKPTREDAITLIRHERSFLRMVAEFTPSLSTEAVKESLARLDEFVETGRLPAGVPAALGREGGA